MTLHRFDWAREPWQTELAEKHSLSCPDGWYGFACGPGWKEILDKAFGELKEKGWSGEIHQIKEKFGGLRMYVKHDGVETFYPIIRKAEEESYKTCEDCGQPGERRPLGWTRTLCDEDYSKQLERLRKRV